MRSTDSLIASLTQDFRAVPRHAVARRLTVALLAGAMVTAALVFGIFGVRADLANALHGPSIWIKWSYTLALAMVAAAAAGHVARPDARGMRWLWLAGGPVALVAALAVAELAEAPSGAWTILWFGHSWQQCPWRVLALSVPIFVGLLWAFRGLAPVRLRLAGAAAGCAAGASAATLYGFACNETSALFLLTWYTLGIAVATSFGALTGPRVLRW